MAEFNRWTNVEPKPCWAKETSELVFNIPPTKGPDKTAYLRAQ